MNNPGWRLDGDDWVPWMPEASHPLYREFRLLSVQSIGQDYSEQKAGLDRLHERTGEDVFVASYNAIRNDETGASQSYTIWPGGIRSWLPRADFIAFTESPDDEPHIYTWDQAVPVVGGLMKSLGLYPERFAVSEFPSKEQFVAMGPDATR
jgi:hypothetical protein